MDEEGVLFSVIVPAYQVENYIGQCIESLLSQCEKNSEVIIVDDGSTDRSGKIADEYADKYKYVNVIHQKNSGLSEARNTGIRHAKGQYCVFVDGDDLLCKHALADLEQCIIDNRNPELIVHRRKQINARGEITECQYWFEMGKMRGLPISEVYSQLQRMPDLWLGAWIFSIRTDYLVNNCFFFAKGLLHEDEEWVPKVVLNAKSIAYNNACFYCYRLEREGSITETPNIKRELDKLTIIDLLEREFSKPHYSAEVRWVARERIRSIFFGVISNVYVYKNDEHFSNILVSIAEKRILLRNSSRLHHKICYILLRFMGEKKTCFIVAKFINWSRKINS